jgi:DNA-binding MarR family transcriptional regulator
MQHHAPPQDTSDNGQDSPRDAHLLDALVTAAFIVMAAITRIGAEHDLSLSLMRVLGILWDRRLRMTDLADYLGLEKQTMSGLIARAEKRGLVARAPSREDRRATDVHLTESGALLVAELRRQGQTDLRPVIAGLGPEDRRHLADLLQAMIAGRAG